MQSVNIALSNAANDKAGRAIINANRMTIAHLRLALFRLRQRKNHWQLLSGERSDEPHNCAVIDVSPLQELLEWHWRDVEWLWSQAAASIESPHAANAARQAVLLACSLVQKAANGQIDKVATAILSRIQQQERCTSSRQELIPHLKDHSMKNQEIHQLQFVSLPVAVGHSGLGLELIGVEQVAEGKDGMAAFKLPLGWRVTEDASHPVTHYLLDNHDRLRALIYVNQSLADRPHVKLCTRYGWRLVQDSRKGSWVEVKDGEQTIWQSITTPRTNHGPSAERQAEQIWSATHWLDSHFPQWQEFSAYWSD